MITVHSLQQNVGRITAWSVTLVFAAILAGCGKTASLQIDLSALGMTRCPALLPVRQLGRGTAVADVRMLDVSANCFTRLDLSTNDYMSLEELYCTDGEVTRVGETIARLPSLRVLDLRNNQIAEFPTGLMYCSTLQTLDLSHNRIMTLPPHLQHAMCMILRLRGNCLSEVHANLWVLAEQVDIGSNRLTRLPDVPPGCAIRSLDVSNNHLTNLPATIVNATALDLLDVRGNRIDPDYLRRVAAMMPWCRMLW